MFYRYFLAFKQLWGTWFTEKHIPARPFSYANARQGLASEKMSECCLEGAQLLRAIM